MKYNNCWNFTSTHIKSRSQRFEPDLVMAVRDFVGTVVAGEEVEGVLIPTTVTDLVSQGLELVHVILRRRFPSKRSVRFTKIPYWDRNVKSSASRKKTTYMYDAEMFFVFFSKELVVAWLPQK